VKGFTLIETLITTAILLPALVVVAFLFAYGAGASLHNQQRTASTLLLSEKMETLRAAALTSSTWNPGAYTEYVAIGPNGALTISSSQTDAPFMRAWQISSTVPRTATVIVYTQRAGLTHNPMEIARATMAASW
jgi:Tfp pilus assembly protein PilV